jgi:hypothetical protein
MIEQAGAIEPIFPLIAGLEPWLIMVIVGVCLAATVLLSGIVMDLAIVRPLRRAHSALPEVTTDTKGAGQIIGKCENLLVFTLVFMGEYEGLGLVMAAKSIGRMEDIKKNPSWYLGGTLVNVTWSMFMGLLARALVVGFA